MGALLTLLADEDPRVGDAISGHLREVGAAALPRLREAVHSLNPTLAGRASGLLREMRLEQVIGELSTFSGTNGRRLEEGLLLIARLHDPELDTAACAAILSHMTEDLMLRLDPGDGVDPMLSALSRYLYDEQGFSGNTEDYYNSANTYLHTLLETRRGIPISLSCLYLVLAQRLGLPIYGVGMPGHFLVKYDDGHQVRVLDPFHKGRALDREGCSRLLRGLGLSFDERYLTPVTTRYILERTLKNLVAVFADRQMAGPLALHQRALEAVRKGA
ncbi:MAG: hypothetical protein HZA24_07480 [Nitrospirae bacterium]|nr:hypothetical protein [Nitrospirota bacterium]